MMIVLALGVLLTGCANNLSRHKIHPDLVGQISEKKVALNLNLPSKHIVLKETQYRVLWLNYQQDKVSYEAVWDSDKDFEEAYQEGFLRMGVLADPKVDSASYKKAFTKLYPSLPMRERFCQVPNSCGPKLDSYSKVYQTPEFDEFAADLISGGYEYLIDVTIPEFIANDLNLGVKVIGSYPTINIIKLDSKDLISQKVATITHRISAKNDLEKIHEDGMAFFKEAVFSGISGSFREKAVWYGEEYWAY